MFSEYMAVALKKAQYKIIDDEYPFFAEVPELEGVWLQEKPSKIAEMSLSK